MMKNIDWYHSLNRPFLSPPDWIFQPVWTILYLLIFLSLFFFLKNRKITPNAKRVSICVFVVQMILNLFWSVVFFNFQNIFAALIICFLLWCLIIAMIILFAKHSKLGAVLLVPYFLWTTFALYLNFSIWRLNSL